VIIHNIPPILRYLSGIPSPHHLLPCFKDVQTLKACFNVSTKLALYLPQIPHLITPIVARPAAVLKHKRRAILHDVRWLAVIAIKEDDDVAKVFVSFGGSNDNGCPNSSKFALAAAVHFHFSASEVLAATALASVEGELVCVDEGEECKQGMKSEEELHDFGW
jgi:hypothetical protein